MQLRNKPAILMVTTAMAIALLFAGCTSGDASSTSSASGSTQSKESIAAAKAIYEPYLAPPKSIGYDAPVAGNLPSHVNAAILENSVGVNQRQNDDIRAAAKLLGWNTTTVPIGNGAEDPAKAFDQALDGHPNVVFYSGYSNQQFSAQLARAQQMGVKAVAECINDPAGSVIIAVLCNPASRDVSAKTTAAYIAANGNGQDHVQLYVSSTFPIDQAYGDSFQKWMKVLCPGCTVTSNSFQVGDIGTRLPTEVVSAVQRDPKTNYVIFCFGDAMTGVVPALESVGLADKVTFGGGLPGTEQYQRMRDGKSDFWVQDNPPWLGYRNVDIAARYLQGNLPTAVTKAPLVSQLLTANNIKDAVFDGKGYWLGYTGYQAAYQKLWSKG